MRIHTRLLLFLLVSIALYALTVTALWHADEGISAHDDVEMEVENAEIAWNGSASGGVADVDKRHRYGHQPMAPGSRVGESSLALLPGVPG